ncbi:MAG: LOG family protein [Planctomycetaceae bacterium]|jgi:uncharacterized protein (TIGR00730 family)|nr:LOG family protein [Planctomycetaceae bacterium]
MSKIAFLDEEFLRSPEARGIRILSEVLKPDCFFQRFGIHSTIIVFGSARFFSADDAAKRLVEAESFCKTHGSNTESAAKLGAAKQAVVMSHYYEQAREFARIVSEENLSRKKNVADNGHEYVICTGGGPGIMEAANRGAYEAGALSVGLNVKLPFEQIPNPYITPELCFQFHYFSIRKLHFMLRAKALVVSPGGYGTFDELFEALTLRQTNRMQAIPVIMFGEEFWRKCVNFDHLVESGVIDKEDLDLFKFTESPRDAWEMIKRFHGEE